MQNIKLQRMTMTALLIAIGVVIPLFSPIKLVLEPASYTLASHVAIFIAMFISPSVALAVTVGTTFGFLLGGFPLVVVLRAASHIVFVAVGSFWLQKQPNLLSKSSMVLVYSFIIGVVHALSEVAVVSVFYFGGSMGAYYDHGFVFSVLGLVGVGGVIHSMVDLAIAIAVLYPLYAQRGLKAVFPYSLPARVRVGEKA